MLCQFVRVYVGKCGEHGVSRYAKHPETGESARGTTFTKGPVEAVDGERFCEYHLGKECVDCGKQAERQCEMASSLVCGKPLCNDCGAICAYHS